MEIEQAVPKSDTTTTAASPTAAPSELAVKQAAVKSDAVPTEVAPTDPSSELAVKQVAVKSDVVPTEVAPTEAPSELAVETAVAPQGEDKSIKYDIFIAESGIAKTEVTAVTPEPTSDSTLPQKVDSAPEEATPTVEAIDPAVIRTPSKDGEPAIDPTVIRTLDLAPKPVPTEVAIEPIQDNSEPTLESDVTKTSDKEVPTTGGMNVGTAEMNPDNNTPEVTIDPAVLGTGGTAGPSGGKTPELINFNALIPTIDLESNNLFATNTNSRGASVRAISQKPTNGVSEIGIFEVDDASGKINGIAPNDKGYLTAAIERARTIFTTLGGDFFDRSAREIDLSPNKFYQFFEIADGSLGEISNELKRGQTPDNIRLSLPDANGNSPIQVTPNSTNDGYNLAIDGERLVVEIGKLAGDTPKAPLGSKYQSNPEGRIIDLSEYAGQTFKADLQTKGSAAYNNQIGFYQVEDANGTIKLDNGTLVRPSDANYAVFAVAQALKNADLVAGKSENKTDLNLTGGKIYAPVLVAQGTFRDFINTNPNNVGGANNIHAYFNYVGANPDKVDHFRALGNNTFGVEDMYGGGDRDFNDGVISLNVRQG